MKDLSCIVRVGIKQHGKTNASIHWDRVPLALSIPLINGSIFPTMVGQPRGPNVFLLKGIYSRMGNCFHLDFVKLGEVVRGHRAARNIKHGYMPFTCKSWKQPLKSGRFEQMSQTQMFQTNFSSNVIAKKAPFCQNGPSQCSDIR